jgi:hypothetical protein
MVRRVEEKIAEIYPSDKIKSPVHLSIGQESVAVGVCEALQPQDAVSGTYRSHATYLVRGGSIKGMFAELYGKARSYLEMSQALRPRAETAQLLAQLLEQLGEDARALALLKEGIALVTGRTQALPPLRQHRLERRQQRH